MDSGPKGMREAAKLPPRPGRLDARLIAVTPTPNSHSNHRGAWNGKASAGDTHPAAAFKRFDRVSVVVLRSSTLQ
jgi:hypothetical protein